MTRRGAGRHLSERFWRHVDERGPTVRAELGPCWVWTGSVVGRGYGKLGGDGGRTVLAHRVSYEIHVGATAGMHVCHRCDNPPCVNPSHLFLGTDKTNSDDREAKGRGVPPPVRPGDTNGSAKLSGSQVAEIRALFGVMKMGEIAAKYGVSPSAVNKIKSGETWKCVDGRKESDRV